MRALVRSFAVACVCLAVSQAQAAAPFVLKSSSFKDGGMLALKYAGKFPGNANCVGQNISPALAWANTPEKTRSFAILMVDPDGAAGLGVVHWLAYGIAAGTTQLAEGEASKDSPKYAGGKNTRDVTYYVGPCAPPGGVHHYHFTIIATDLAPDALPPGLTRDELLAKLKDHALAASGLVALYEHP
jgi:Raf kinase inhibitor-like YbhB/YbcL family protein